jgi:hypothetical protein
MTARLKETVSSQLDQLVENFASGKGGPEQEYTYLPTDIDN